MQDVARAERPSTVAKFVVRGLLVGSLISLALLRGNSRAIAQGENYDVVVYGGTSAAVTAAIEASRSGKSVALISPDHHLGGLSSNGLGWTDIGSANTIGGLSRDFYRRVYDHYQDPAAWTFESEQTYRNRSSLDPYDSLQMMFTFEPKIARQIFEDMIGETNVTVVSGRLNRETGVSVTGTRINSIETEGGAVYHGKAFIDATYEGDLMAAAGVKYTIGRESNSQYGETLNGIQIANSSKNQLPTGIDPYVVPGVPSSGLLPGVNPSAGGTDGQGDNKLQAFNYRMVLTNHVANRTPVPQPTDYDENDYELLFRAIEAGQTNRFFKLSPMPNKKTDSNNDNGFSTDFIGGNYSLETNVNYAEADYATRDEMIQAHRDYQMGFVWTLQNHPQVPQSIRNSWDDWGLPPDEFTDNGHWPNQIYVREARRMVGEVVVTQNHVDQEPGFTFSDSVGMGGYNMDSHHVQRYVHENGYVWNEGDVQQSPANGPYPISYRAMVPRQGDVDNLVVPVAVSASHIAYGSLRMEPVFMALGHSAGSAASIISDQGVASREIPYGLLRSQLWRSEQILGVDYTSPDPGILLNFGATVSDNGNSAGHEFGGIPGEHWNVISGDTSAGIEDSTGTPTGVMVDLGKSLAGQQILDWEADGFTAIAAGSVLNFGVYDGNASSALFVDDGKSSEVDLGVRISGLDQGIYDTFLSAKNTNTIFSEEYNIYSMVVDSASGDTDYNGQTPALLENDSAGAWAWSDNFAAITHEIGQDEDLVIVVEGITGGELRGFLNTLEIVKLAGTLSADVDFDGDVDTDDFVLIRDNLFNSVPIGTLGDANSDTVVDQKDFYFWRRVFLEQGGDLSALASLQVPEPSTLSGCCLFTVCMVLKRRRRSEARFSSAVGISF